jgi:hypothetical protein
MKGDDRGENQRFQNWVTLVKLKYKKPCKNLSVLASRSCVLFKSLPNNASLKELYFQACVFGTVKDILITPPEDRPNSSRFFRIEYSRNLMLIGLRSILPSSFSLKNPCLETRMGISVGTEKKFLKKSRVKLLGP